MCLNTGKIISLSQKQKEDSPVFQLVFIGLLQAMVKHQEATVYSYHCQYN